MTIPTAVQGLGIAAFLLGLFLALPLYGALLTAGLVVFVLGTAAEVVVQRVHSGPSAVRSGPSGPGVG